LREISSKNGALLIFDEVISGFRIALGGVQGEAKIKPDLTTLGKIIGGGLPVAAYGGRREIMQMLAPLGPVYQAGTLSGNPLAMRAGLATLPHLRTPNFYPDLNLKSRHLADGFRAAFREAGVPAQINSAGSLLTIFFNENPIHNYDDAKKSDTNKFAKFFNEMLDRDIFLPPSQYEALFISAAHTEADINETIQAARESLKSITAQA
jgi:glutamate-1-semialdehyde 2,1-aminomutase